MIVDTFDVIYKRAVIGKDASSYFKATLSNGQGVPGSALFYVLYLADFIRGVIQVYRRSYVFGSSDPTLSYADDVVAVCKYNADLLHFDYCFQHRANFQRSIINYAKLFFLIIHPPDETLYLFGDELLNNGNVIKRCRSLKMIDVIFQHN